MEKTNRANPIFGGIYYVIRTPAGWKLVTYSFKRRDDDANHYEWWEEAVAGQVAKEWVKKSGPKQMGLKHDLAMLTYAFPRGRLSVVDGRMIFLHGADLTTTMGVSKKEIEQAFGISSRSKWEFDEHEQCQSEDKEEIRRLLNIPENWHAVSFEDQ